MTWIGVTDHDSGRFSLSGIAAAPAAGAALEADQLITRGTLLLETRLPSVDRPCTLLAIARSRPWPGFISLRLLPEGNFVLTEAQGRDLRNAILPCLSEKRADVVRLSFSWDTSRNLGRFSLERPQSGQARTAATNAVRPMLLDDLRKLMQPRSRREFSPEVVFAAVSDTVEPVGPMPGLTAGTPISTRFGETPVCKLQRGDLVRSETGELVPVLAIVRRTVPARGSFHPIRLRAGYFGLRRDIVVAPHQQILIRGSDVEYMFGREAALLPAQHLVNHMMATPARGGDLVTYYQLILPENEVLRVNGALLASLFIGRIRRKPEALEASLLAGLDRARLPEHAQPPWPVLKPFEAVTLAASRAA